MSGEEAGAFILTATQIASGIPDAATVVVVGSGGGLLEPDLLLEAIETRFLASGHPRDLSIFHAFGLGDGKRQGMNRLAHKGLVRRVIGGHWSWSPAMQKLAEENLVEAYALPTGVMCMLLREIGAGRPGLITRTGLGTFVDPKLQGGRLNSAATVDLVERVEIDGDVFLRYKPFRVDVSLIRGTSIDSLGNLTTREEPADLDVHPAAMAAKASGGVVYAQVRDRTDRLDAREVTVPRPLIDAVAVHPAQAQTYRGKYRPDFAGRSEPVRSAVSAPTGLRRVIAWRAAREMPRSGVINLGFGISAAVAELTGGAVPHVTITAEQGIYNGSLETGDLFGVASGPSAILAAATQFDYYSGGSLAVAFLGMAEMDGDGNVNVSHIGPRPVGPGGFIDISQNARKVVFCGSFEAKGSKVENGPTGLRIIQPGLTPKLVHKVQAITFSGALAQATGQEVLYVTERAVFRLAEEGVELIEVAPGIDLRRDVLERMRFAPIVRRPSVMPMERVA